MNRTMIGALAGLIATAPMTAAMIAMLRRLPPQEQYPLPPRRITMRMLGPTGARELNAPQRNALTMVNHFGYGAAIGAVYGPLAKALKLPPIAGGIGYGLAVWTGSYLGWLPATGVLEPASNHPMRRNALMIAAHVVWGAAAGAIDHCLASEAERTSHSGSVSQAASTPPRAAQSRQEAARHG